MTKRRCRNPHKTPEEGALTEAQVLELAMRKLNWKLPKVISWYNLENAALNHARPRELVERGDTDRIVTLLDKREADRLKEDRKRNEEN